MCTVCRLQKQYNNLHCKQPEKSSTFPANVHTSFELPSRNTISLNPNRKNTLHPAPYTPKPLNPQTLYPSPAPAWTAWRSSPALAGL